MEVEGVGGGASWLGSPGDTPPPEGLLGDESPSPLKALKKIQFVFRLYVVNCKLNSSIV